MKYFLKKRTVKIMFKKNVLVIFLVFLFFTVISSVAAADYYVDNNTKHSDIVNWMKNDAKNGDNLIFTGSKYDLTDTITVNKSIDIKSENKTQINFNKKNKNMFKVAVSGVNFEGLSLNYHGSDYKSVIYASGAFKKINIKNTDIKVTSSDVDTINIGKWLGNITNCKINIESQFSGALTSNVWTGNIVNSKIITGTGLGTQHVDAIIRLGKWKGNIINSEIYTNSSCAISAEWKGKITGSKIHCGIDKKNTYTSYGLFLPGSKGTITKSTIKVFRGSALGIPDEVKVSNCTLSSGKKYPNINRFRSDLVIDSVKKSGKFYKVSFSNMAFVIADSKPCTLVIKCGNKILKKVNVKSLEGVMEGPQKTIKVAIPAKYANKKYTKTAIIDYYNVNKEYNRKNNQYKFKF